MPRIKRNRRATILLCGAVNAMLVLFAPSVARSEPPEAGDCLEPWIESIVPNAAGCADCAAYCANHAPKGTCEVEWNYCQPEGGAYANECTCQPKLH